jgi:predicted nucleotidyltransferase component of viral defense system
MINKNNSYYRQVELLLKVLPYVARESCFALKGGTAINFFVRDMPRLSVDIDLTYLPIESRNITLTHIEEALIRIKESVLQYLPNTVVREKRILDDTRLVKLFISQRDILIKIEPNVILRGSVYPCENRDLKNKASEIFELTVSDVPILSMADLYGGKICAALSRQHPRDLFDVKLLLENEGITDSIRQAFLIYLASSPRPMHELLNPNPILLNMLSAYEDEFVGMTEHQVSFEELIEVRQQLTTILLNSLTNNERKFLISIKKGEPDWGAIPIEGIDKLPSLNWKIINITKMEIKKHQTALDKLKDVLKM